MALGNYQPPMRVFYLNACGHYRKRTVPAGGSVANP